MINNDMKITISDILENQYKYDEFIHIINVNKELKSYIEEQENYIKSQQELLELYKTLFTKIDNNSKEFFRNIFNRRIISFFILILINIISYFSFDGIYMSVTFFHSINCIIIQESIIQEYKNLEFLNILKNNVKNN